MPALASRIWHIFFELHGARRYTDGVPESLGFTDIQAFGTLTGEKLLPRDVRTLRAMDGVFIRTFSEEQRESEARRKEEADAQRGWG